jgi:hypothetical protein
MVSVGKGVCVGNAWIVAATIVSSIPDSGVSTTGEQAAKSNSAKTAPTQTFFSNKPNIREAIIKSHRERTNNLIGAAVPQSYCTTTII